VPGTPHNAPPELPSKSRRLARRYWWTALGTVAIVGLALSIAGFWSIAPPEEGSDVGRLLTSLYQSLLGFWFNAGGAGVPWTVQIGRFMTLAAAAIIGGGLIFDVLRAEMRRSRARRMNGHVIVCGLGELGRAAADSVLAGEDKRGLTIVENTPSFDTEAFARRGAGIVIGDATDPLTLLEAGADRARHLIACCGSDDLNASVAEAARSVVEQVGRNGEDALAVRVHIGDPGLLRQLRPCILEIARPGLDVDFFSVAEMAARQIVGDTIGGELARGSSDIDVAVVGDSALAEQLVLQIARTTPASVDEEPRPVVGIITHSAESLRRFLLARHRHLTSHLELRAVDVPEAHGDPDMEAALAERGSAKFRYAFVCADDDAETVRTALSLAAATRRAVHDVTVVACIYGQSGIAALAERSNEHGLTVFDATDAMRDPKLITLDTIDYLARLVHESYFQDELAKPASERTPQFKHWNDLDAEDQEDNRDHVRHFLGYLETAGLRLVPLSDEDEEPAEIEGETLESLAQNEHERWCQFKIAHAWRLGERDKAHKRHECLVPWEELDKDQRPDAHGVKKEPQRDKDRGPIKRMPKLLKDAGIALVKVRSDRE